MSELQAHFNEGGDEALRGRSSRAGLLGYAEHILERLAPPHGGSVLDAGCGDGAVLRVVKELRPDLQCTGIDFAEQQIARARERNAGREQCAFHVANLLDGALEIGRFDRIYSFSVAQYFTHAQLCAICSRLKGALNPGGVLAHLSIPDLRKRALLFDESFVNANAPGPLRHWLALAKMVMVDAKRTLTGDVAYGGDSLFHDAEALARECGGGYEAKVLRPSDSWYRFDLVLAPI